MLYSANKIMNELIRNIARIPRHKTLFLLILLLALAAVADRFCLQDKQVANGSAQMLTAGLPLPDEDTGNRAGTGAPSDNGAAAQLVQFISQKDSGPGRTRFHREAWGRSVLRTDRVSRTGILRTTAPMVSSDLGRLFTLVGAKPSGTS